MKKLKFNLGDGGFQGILIRHVEKIALFTAILLIAVFFCMGYFVDSLPAEKTPVALSKRNQQVKLHITADNWPLLEVLRTPDLRHPERVDEGRKPTNEEAYRIVSFDTPLLRQKLLRTDPRLYAPIKLEVTSQWVPLAYVPAKGESDEISEQPIAMLKQDNKPVKKRATRPRSRPKNKSHGDDLLSFSASQDDDDDNDSSSGYDSRGANEQHRVLTSHQKAALGGFHPSGEAIAKSKFLVAVKAVVPFELQWKEFEALRNSNDYDAKRDVPVYRWFYVERAEARGAQAVALDWKPLRTRARGFVDLAKKGGWVATAEEQADPESVDKVLTLPLPPVLAGSLKRWALHSAIRVRKEPAHEELEDSNVATMDDRPDGPSPPGSGKSPGKQSKGRDSKGGFGWGAFGQGGAEFGDESTPETLPPKYKLIRFFDTSAEPGKTYRYRIKVQLFDPNRPFDSKHEPRIETLAPEVQARLEKLDSDEGGIRKTCWVQSEWSEPSEMVHVRHSPPRVLASVVTPPRETVLPAPGAVKSRFVEKEPQATVVASIWDKALAVRVATEFNAIRGAILDVTNTVDVLHPITRQFHTLEAYELRTGSVLLDMRGGEILPGQKAYQADKSELFHAPKVLIVDQFGNLSVGNEFDDVEERRQELYLEDEPPAADPSSSGQPGSW